MTQRLSAGVTLVLGGARSGKSAFAEKLVENCGLQPVYLATGRAFDSEMEARIGKHQQRRGSNWHTVEEPLGLAEALLRQSMPGRAVLVDCLSLWLTNLMMAKRDVGEACASLLAVFGELGGPVVLVANEVGLGIVPENAMAREFRDHAGEVNQQVAARADTVIFVAAGLPLVLKPINQSIGEGA